MLKRKKGAIMKKITLSALTAPLLLSTFLSAAGPVGTDGKPLGPDFQPLDKNAEPTRLTYMGVTGRRSLSIFWDAEAPPSNPAAALVHLNCRQLDRRIAYGALARGMTSDDDAATRRSLDAQQAQFFQAVKALGCPVIEI
jgi:hypothetical protein